MAAGNLEEILDFAIAREQEAHDFYMDLAKKAERPGMGGLFQQFAREELGHKKKLEGIKRAPTTSPSKQVVDLKIGDYLVDVDPRPPDLPERADPGDGREGASALHGSRRRDRRRRGEEIFESLAQEEAKHKLRFEVEYDDMILTEN
jgi:rubrerythrin